MACRGSGVQIPLAPLNAKDLPTTYKDVAALLEDIKDPERHARKTLTQLEKYVQ